MVNSKVTMSKISRSMLDSCRYGAFRIHQTQSHLSKGHGSVMMRFLFREKMHSHGNLRFCNFNLSRSFWCVLPRAKNVRSKIKIVLKKTSDSCRHVCLLGSFQQSVQNTDNKSAKSLISNSVEPNMRRTKPSQEDLTGLFSVKYLWFQSNVLHHGVIALSL